MKPRIIFAKQDAVESLRPYVDKIVAVVEEVIGVSGSWVTDESCLSDFAYLNEDKVAVRDALYDKLGIELDPDNEDDNYIVKIAYKLKHRTT